MMAPKQHTRAIDKLLSQPADPAQQKSEQQPHMQVLVLGAPRSGTTSLGTALEMLGLRTCIGVADSFVHDDKFPYWTEAIDAKYHGVGRAYGTPELRRMLQGYEAVTGFGAALLADELLVAFPEARVILTERRGGAEEWVRSYKETIVATYVWWKRWAWILPCSKAIYGEFVRFKSAAVRAWCYGDELDREQQMRCYREHNERVKRTVRRDKLLVHQPGAGWGPLCEFLGKDVPTKEYPHSASRVELQRYMVVIWKRAVGHAVLRVASSVAGAVMMVVVACWRGTRVVPGMLEMLRGRIGPMRGRGAS